MWFVEDTVYEYEKLLSEDPPNYSNLKARVEKIKGIFAEYKYAIIEFSSSNADHELVSEYVQMQDEFFELSTCCLSIPPVVQGSSSLSSVVQLPTNQNFWIWW